MARLSATCEVKNIFINPGGEIIAELSISYKNYSMKYKHATKYVNISKVIKEWEK